VTNEKGAITAANRATLKLFGVQQSAVMGLRLEQCIAFDNEELVRRLQRIGGEGSGAEAEDREFETAIRVGAETAKGFRVDLRSDNEEPIAILSHSPEAIDLGEKIKEAKLKIEDITTRIFPRDTRPLFALRSAAPISANHCRIVGLPLLEDCDPPKSQFPQPTNNQEPQKPSIRSIPLLSNQRNKNVIRPRFVTRRSRDSGSKAMNQWNIRNSLRVKNHEMRSVIQENVRETWDRSLELEVKSLPESRSKWAPKIEIRGLLW
jgi:hypothetical protein